MWKWYETVKSHDLNIYFIFVSDHFRILGPGTQALKRRQGPGPGPARRRFGARAWVVGAKTWKWLKIMRNSYGNNVIQHFLTQDPVRGGQSSYDFHTVGHILFTSFSYFCAVLVWGAFPYANLCKTRALELGNTWKSKYRALISNWPHFYSITGKANRNTTICPSFLIVLISNCPLHCLLLWHGIGMSQTSGILQDDRSNEGLMLVWWFTFNDTLPGGYQK